MEEMRRARYVGRSLGFLGLSFTQQLHLEALQIPFCWHGLKVYFSVENWLLFLTGALITNAEIA